MKSTKLIIGADAQNFRIITEVDGVIKEKVFRDDAKDRNELSMINEFLKSADFDLKNFVKIGTIIHPHNNTSVRVAQTIAQTFAWFLGIPIIEIHTDNLLDMDAKDLFLKL